jgi:4-hydroxy-tetrahydrodipicolinate synthase
MEKLLFTGVCTALVTPFLGGQVNYPMMMQLLRRQMDAGIEAVVIAGTTGESPTLSDREKLTLFAKSKEFVGDRMKIICGTGSNDTAHAVQLSVAAQEAGADGVLVVSPYYNKAPADGLVAHYMAVAHAVSIPVIAYNVPGRTGVDIPVSVYQRLSHIPNMAGVKEASADIVKTLRIQNACGENFSVWSGNDEMAAAAMAIGAKGVISVVSNVAPEMTAAMAKAALDGDMDTAAALQRRLLPLIDALFSEVNPMPVKAALAMQGYDCGPCRLPLCDVKEETRKLLQTLL